MNWVEEESENDEDKNEDEEHYVLGIDGSGSPPFMMKGKINRKKICLMIDSGSPVTIINYEELQKILQYETLFVRPLPPDEKYVDYNKKTRQLTGIYILRTRSRRKIYPKGKVISSETGCKIHRRQRLAELPALRHRTKKGG